MLEVLEDLPALDAIVVPVGGGGLISGIGIAARALVAVDSGDWRRGRGLVARSRGAWRRAASLTIDVQPSLADGLTGNLDPDTITFDIVRSVVDHIEVVDERELRQALAGVADQRAPRDRGGRRPPDWRR